MKRRHGEEQLLAGRPMDRKGGRGEEERQRVVVKHHLLHTHTHTQRGYTHIHTQRDALHIKRKTKLYKLAWPGCSCGINGRQWTAHSMGEGEERVTNANETVTESSSSNRDPFIIFPFLPFRLSFVDSFFEEELCPSFDQSRPFIIF